MNILKILGKFFGGLFILIALTIVFAGLFINYGLENINVLSDSAETNLPIIMEENKEMFAEKLFQNQEINKEQLGQLCIAKPEELPEDFCNKLPSLTEEDVKNELMSVLLLKIQKDFEPEIQGFEQNIKSQLEESEIFPYTKIVIPVGIVIFLLGSLLIFLSEKFKWKIALFYISLKTGIISLFTAIGNYFTKNITSEQIGTIINALPIVAQDEQGMPEFAVNLIAKMLTEWIRVVSEKLFAISLTITIISLSIAVITFILKRKKKEEVKENKVEIKEEVKVEKKNKTKKNLKKKSKK